jgi:queuine tRNA-ribosyltransferase subunit QTRTD1
MFTTVKATGANLLPRLGRLSLPGRNAIETPHYLGLTSRGVVPHLSQDNFAQLSSITGVYAALEDCRFSAKALLSRQRADKSTYTAV